MHNSEVFFAMLAVFLLIFVGSYDGGDERCSVLPSVLLPGGATVNFPSSSGVSYGLCG